MTEMEISIQAFVEAIHRQSVKNKITIEEYLTKSEYYAVQVFEAAMQVQVPCAIMKLLPNEGSIVQVLKLLNIGTVDSVYLIFVNDKLCIPCEDEFDLQIKDSSLKEVLRIVNEDNFGQLRIDSKVIVANYPLDVFSFDAYYSKLLV